MFGLFGNSKAFKTTDIVWKNDAAKFRGILKNSDPKRKTIYLYYFSETRNRMLQLLETAGIDFASTISSHDTISVADTSSVISSGSDLSGYTICFLEHHPSYLKEHAILEHLQNDLHVKEVVFYTSLEEPLLHYFGGERIVEMLEKMGFSEEEPLQHDMISKAIVNAQKKIDEKTPGAVETSTAKNWIEVNLPSASS